MNQIIKIFSFTCFCVISFFVVSAEIKLPALFADNMVLQQQADNPVWGWADPGEKITVTGSWNNRPVTAKTTASGKWMLKIKTPRAGGPYTLTIEGKQIIKLDNVMIGEVWVCSGQSNMEMPVKGWVGAPVLHSEKEIKSASYPNIRLFKVNRKIAFSPQDNCDGYWSECNPETVADFSATAYFFGRSLYEKLKIPIGLVVSSWGGTVAEAWTSESGLNGIKDFKKSLEKIDTIRDNLKDIEAKEHIYMKDWEKNKNIINNTYTNINYNTNKWDEMKLPVNWERAGYPDLDGIVWFRKVIHIPSSWKGKPLRLDLGAIDDEDITWFNGQKVGFTRGWQTDRSYVIPADMVKEGKNVIAVRVADEAGGGGIYGDSGLLNIYPEHASSDQGINLSGNWKFKIEYVKHQMAGLNNPNLPTVLFNGMINPLIPFGIRGVIWYQGESNVGRATQYAKLFPALIQDWRKKWHEGDFPFYYVQIAPFPYGGNGTAGAALRDAQRKSLQVSNTGMAVTLDIGDTTNIHPANKEEVGRRLSLWALNKIYKKINISYSGPLYKRMKVKRDKAIISFTNTDGGLVAKGEALTCFEIAGADGKFVKAKARIQGKKIVVYAKKVTHPKAVRYGWRDTDVPHLFNKAGLPASSFSTPLHE